MRSKPQHRAKAREMRAQGKSIRTIAVDLGVAKSSVSVWVRDVLPGGMVLRPRETVDLRTCPRVIVWKSGRTRRCARCKCTLPQELFGITKRGRQSWCRACFRAHARQRGSAHREQVRDAYRRRLRLARQIVLRYVGEHGCCDCGERDVVVLELDHIGEKAANVANLVRKGARPERIHTEMSRCDVVCANCHRRRTAERAGWVRASATWRLELGSRATTRARNQLHVYEHLTAAGCIDCGLRELVVLDFDHVGPKRDGVMRLAAGEVALKTLDAEIQQCEVRCANCHRRRTAAKAGHYRALGDLGVGHLGDPSTIEVQPDRRERARELRREGLTIAEIAEVVGAAVGSVAAWVRDVPWGEDERVAMHARRRTARAKDSANGATLAAIRVCTKCGVEQPLAQFSRRGTGHRSQCKSCDAERNRSRTPEERARAAAAQRERRRLARERRAGDAAVT